MVFDKNLFKDAFRSWVEHNPKASSEDALEFCQKLIPTGEYSRHYWLVEQSLQWFKWLQESKSTLLDEDSQLDSRFFQPASRNNLC